MKTPIILWLIFVVCYVAFCGCASKPPESPSLHIAKVSLMTTLALRDTQTLDLVVVGQSLVQQFGKEVAFEAVKSAWYEQTDNVYIMHVTDVMWLQDKPHRVQDLAWLLNFQTQWLK